MRKFATTIAFLMITVMSWSQKIGFATGIAFDLRNDGYKQVPLSVQWLPDRTPQGSFILKLDAGLPLRKKGTGMAYTLADNLPPEVKLERKIGNFQANFQLGYRGIVNPRSSWGQIYIDFLPLGIGYSRWKVDYKGYDKTNYEVVNEEIGREKWGYNLGGGMGYQNKAFLVQVHLNSPLFVKERKYEVSYRMGVPLQITAGYFIHYTHKGKDKPVL